MIQRILIFLLLTTAAASAAASEDRVDIAYREGDARPLNTARIAPPAVIEKYDYYEIKGDCEKDMHSELCKNGCTWNDGKKFDSLTTWDVKWDYGYDRGAGACSVEAFRVTVDINYRFPIWPQTPGASRELVEKWGLYMGNLVTHEKGHRDLVVRAAEGLSRAVADLPPAPTCDELDRNVRALGRVAMKKMEKDQKEYDATTRHGVTQGAVFP
jgi:predicted secreted Zn-dependent protease